MTLGAAMGAGGRSDGAGESSQTGQQLRIIKPGLFNAAADARRNEFDVKNGVIVHNKVPVEFVFAGDSITQMWELNAYFRPGKGIIVNRGISADVSRYLKKRFQADVVQLNPEHVIVLIGINNPWMEEYQSQTQDKIVEDIGQDMEEMTRAAKEHGVRFVLCSLMPVELFDDKENADKNALVCRINEVYRRIASKSDSIYVDYHSHFVREDGLRQKPGLTEDGVHPIVFGYNTMAKVLRDTLAEHGITI